MVPQLPFLQISYHYFFYPGDFGLITLVSQHLAAYFCLNDDYSNCPNFWAIKLEALLCSTANIKFPCSLQLQQCPLLLEAAAKAGGGTDLCFSKTGQRHRNSGCRASTQHHFLPLRHLIPPWLLQSHGESYNIQSGTVHLKDPFQEAFRDSRERILVWVLRLKSCIPSFRPQPGKKHAHELTVLTSLHKFSQAEKHVSLVLFTELITSVILLRKFYLCEFYRNKSN